MLHEASPLAPCELAAMLSAYPFQTPVFILPPWEAIYVWMPSAITHLPKPWASTPRSWSGIDHAATPFHEVPRLPQGNERNMSVESWALITSDAFVGKPRPHERSRHPT